MRALLSSGAPGARSAVFSIAAALALGASAAGQDGKAQPAPSPDAAAEAEAKAKEQAAPSKDPNQLALDGVRAFEKGDLDAGRTHFEALLELEPESVVGLVNLGSLEYRAKRLEQAEKWLRKATRVSPDTFSAWLTLGVVAYEAGKVDLALAALSQAVLLDPSNPKAHSYLGVTVGRKGWLDGAEAELQRTLELDETLPDAHFNLAVIYLQRNPPAVELARTHYRRAVDLGAKPDSLIEKQLERSKEPVKTVK